MTAMTLKNVSLVRVAFGAEHTFRDNSVRANAYLAIKKAGKRGVKPETLIEKGIRAKELGDLLRLGLITGGKV